MLFNIEVCLKEGNKHVLKMGLKCEVTVNRAYLFMDINKQY